MGKDKKPGGFVRFVKWSGIILVVLFVAALIWGLTLPKDISFERSTTVNADKDEIHALVGDLRKWDEWGPWRAEDPDMEYTYSETTTEPGDKMSWTSTMGDGSVEFTEVDPENGVEYLFQMGGSDPVPGAITYEETDDGEIEVSWIFDSQDTPFFSRYFLTLFEGVMTDMFDKGLAGLKREAEADE